MTEEQNQRVTDILVALRGELDKPDSCITGRAVGFVKDQIARHEQYGIEMFISPAQRKWLEDLYASATGEPKRDEQRRDDLEPVDDHMARTTGRPRRAEDLDDDIPF